MSEHAGNASDGSSSHENNNIFDDGGVAWKRGADTNWEQFHHDPKSLRTEMDSSAQQVTQSNAAPAGWGFHSIVNRISKVAVPLIGASPTQRAAEALRSGSVEQVSGPRNFQRGAVSRQNSVTRVNNLRRNSSNITLSRQGSISDDGQRMMKPIPRGRSLSSASSHATIRQVSSAASSSGPEPSTQPQGLPTINGHPQTFLFNPTDYGYIPPSKQPQGLLTINEHAQALSFNPTDYGYIPATNAQSPAAAGVPASTVTAGGTLGATPAYSGVFQGAASSSLINSTPNPNLLPVDPLQSLDTSLVFSDPFSPVNASAPGLSQAVGGNFAGNLQAPLSSSAMLNNGNMFNFGYNMFDGPPIDYNLPPFSGWNAPENSGTGSHQGTAKNNAKIPSVRAPRKSSTKSKGKEKEKQRPGPESNAESQATNTHSALPTTAWPSVGHPDASHSGPGPSTFAQVSSYLPPSQSFNEPPLLPNAAASGVGDVLTFMSGRFETVMTAFQQAQSAQQSTFSTMMDAFQQQSQGRPQPIPEVDPMAVDEDETAFDPIVKEPKRMRRAFVPSIKNKPETEPKPPTLKECKEYDNFLAHIRKHTLIMLGIKSLKYLSGDRFTLSEEENENFNQDLPGCIVITSDKFRLDLSRDRDTPFNAEAVSVFAQDFHYKVVVHGWYSRPDIPERYRDVGVIREAFYNHFRYLKERFVQLLEPSNKTETRLQKASRAGRKRRLYKDRLQATTATDTLAKHAKLLQVSRLQAMSSDESDDESHVSPNKKKGSNVFPRVYPAWRSSQFATFLWRLDALIEANRVPIVGTRKKPGTPRRQRPHSQKQNTQTPAPPRLPRNCYDAVWLQNLKDSHPRLYRLLECVDVDYSFDGFDDDPTIPLNTVLIPFDGFDDDPAPPSNAVQPGPATGVGVASGTIPAPMTTATTLPASAILAASELSSMSVMTPTLTGTTPIATPLVNGSTSTLDAVAQSVLDAAPLADASTTSPELLVTPTQNPPENSPSGSCGQVNDAHSPAGENTII
ncbi:hypothetical protein BJ138DRAFT_1129573 [Hygrophoropsis aurantiaca]|uniref:Uncharacterized protein n=1 Tax=Hygrophoropsis aurantiaca TaxID=72124 RepID=A0ACB8A1S6_9AGAM|nr:hypothetical protein BJ138DRAFT_1129573 [Hygrophoropsis aurantiaca]